MECLKCLTIEYLHTGVGIKESKASYMGSITPVCLNSNDSADKH